MNDKKYLIMSLGTNCLPRTILTRWKIKPSKSEGELSYPFDLVFHTLPLVVKCLENDFEDYLSGFYFKIRKRNFLDFRKKGIWYKEDGTGFWHDTDCKINDREKLEVRIKKRIENFRQAIKSDIPILFVINIMDNPEYIDKLYKILKKLCSHKKFKLAVINFGYLYKNENSEIYSLDLPIPFDGYHGVNGWNSKFKDTNFGKFTEKCICHFVEEIIKKDFI